MKWEFEFSGVDPLDAAAATRAITRRLWGLLFAVALFFLILGFLFGAGLASCPGPVTLPPATVRPIT